MVNQSSTALHGPAPGKKTRRWIVLVLGLLAGVLVAELLLRHLLFADSAWVQSLAGRWKLRRPELYADPTFDDDYWKLQRLFLPTAEERSLPPQVYDPLLGWRTPLVLANYDHAQHAAVAGRRPLLLFGASYSQAYFDELLAASEMASEFELLDYSVGGYGPDQAYLLMRRSLDHFAGQNPVVVFGWEVTGDLDRVALSIRIWPKPHATLSPAGQLEFDDAPIPSVAEYLERNPPAIKSYLLRALDEHATPESSRRSRTRERRQAKRLLLTQLVRAIDDELNRRGIDYFYVLFCSQSDCRLQGPRSWQEEFLSELFEREGIAYELALPVMIRALVQNGESIGDYYHQPPDPRMDHPSERGATVLLDCFRNGLGKL